MNSRGVWGAATLAMLIFGATACGSDQKSSATVPVPAEQKPSVNGEAANVPTDAASGGGTSADSTTPPVGVPEAFPQERFLAIDVTFGIEVDDIDKGIDGVVTLAARHAGQIYERDINIADDRSSRAAFVIKLPPDEVEGAIADLDAIGVRRSASQGTEDVTSQVVDIDARLTTARASLIRVRKLLENATDLGQILSLESQLTERETTVEQYEAMKRALDERVSLATLRVNLSLTAEPEATTEPVKKETDRSVADAFRTGWHGFIKALAAVLIFIGYTAPFLVAGLIAAGVSVVLLRQRRRRPTPPPFPAPQAAEDRPSQPVDVSA